MPRPLCPSLCPLLFLSLLKPEYHFISFSCILLVVTSLPSPVCKYVSGLADLLFQFTQSAVQSTWIGWSWYYKLHQMMFIKFCSWENAVRTSTVVWFIISNPKFACIAWTSKVLNLKRKRSMRHGNQFGLILHPLTLIECALRSTRPVFQGQFFRAPRCDRTFMTAL